MITKKPHIVLVDGYEYELGKLKNNTIHYDFEKLVRFLDAKGKSEFGQNFKIFEEDFEIIYKLCCYIIEDKQTCEKMNIDIQKGILLSGPIGSGKTSIMKLLRFIVPHKRQYKIIPCRNTVFSFNLLGFKTIEDYGNEGYYCFDDLGLEPSGRHFGKDCNVMGEILLSRYDMYSKTLSLRVQSRSLTHATTNLNAKELEERYGNRVRSRMRELFNLIAFHENSMDKRK